MPSNGKVQLDSEDLTTVSKAKGFKQKGGAVHEFGHMLGLLDEYNKLVRMRQILVVLRAVLKASPDSSKISKYAVIG